MRYHVSLVNALLYVVNNILLNVYGILRFILGRKYLRKPIALIVEHHVNANSFLQKTDSCFSHAMLKLDELPTSSL